MCLQTLVACFKQWRSAAVYTHQLEKKLVLKWQSAALAAAFAAFRANTEKQQLKKRVGMFRLDLAGPLSGHCCKLSAGMHE